MLAFVKRFSRDDAGSASVEIALWMPFFWLVFGFIIDATMLFQYQTHFMDVAREASRQVSIDNMSPVEAYDYVVAQFAGVDNLNATIMIDGNSVTATVDAPMSSLTIFSDMFTGQARVNGSISMFMEAAATQTAGLGNEGV